MGGTANGDKAIQVARTQAEMERPGVELAIATAAEANELGTEDP